MTFPRFFFGGMFTVAALLVVGLTWIGPSSTESADPVAPAEAATQQFRMEGEGTGEVVEVNLEAVSAVQEIADGLDYQVWTFNGTAPGPVIRVKVGDTVRFTLTNNDELGLSHSIDFHAAQTPWDKNYVPVAPGESITFDWVARFPGVFMYHCGVPPVLHHIANGMYGAIIVEPQEALPEAREYVLVSSEFYPGDKPVEGVFEGDGARMEDVDPEYVVFDGKANRYLDAPLVAKPDEPIRLWVMNAGPTVDNAFHVIGAVFDHVYPDGNPTTPLNGMQTYNIPPGGGAMFELSIPDEGVYPFVNHAFAYTGKGILGAIQVSADAPEAPASYPLMADPFTAGVEESGHRAAVAEAAPATEEATASEGEEGDVVLTAANVAYEPGTLIAQPGQTVTVVNEDAMFHDVVIDELGIEVGVKPGETATFTIPEDGDGTFTFYCSVPGHREAGMEGSLMTAGH